jgi:hypothetical protein
VSEPAPERPLLPLSELDRLGAEDARRFVVRSWRKPPHRCLTGG